MGDAMMMLGRGRCREGEAENNSGGKRNFCLAEHFCISPGCLGLAPIDPFADDESEREPVQAFLKEG